MLMRQQLDEQQQKQQRHLPRVHLSAITADVKVVGLRLRQLGCVAGLRSAIMISAVFRLWRS
jgi:hypothetical protein